MIDGARRSASQQYRAAAQSQQPFEQSLTYVLDRWNRQLQGRTSDEANAVRTALDRFYDPIQTVAPSGGAGPTQMRIVSDLNEFVARRAGLNRQINDSYRINPQTGAREASADTFWLTRLKNHIDAAVGRNNPEWRRANQQWADMRLDQIGEHLGDVFATRAGPMFRRQIAEFDGLHPQAQDIVRIHFLQKLYDKLDNLGDTHAVSKMFANDHARNMIRHLFGDDAVVAFTRAVRDQKVAEGSQRMMANSATHRRGVAQKQKDADTGIMAAVENANARGVRNWLLEKGQQILTENRNRPMSSILTTPMRDTAEVARHLHNLREQQSRLAKFSRPPTWPLPAATSASEAITSAFNREKRQ